MKRLVIENLSDVAELMYSDIAEKGLFDVEFIGFYEDVVIVLKQLLAFDKTVPYFINISDVDFDWDDYEKEYSVILDADMNVWCEKAYNHKNNCYLMVTSDRLYFADDCDPALLECIESDKDEIFEVTYGLESEEETEKDYPKKDSHEIVTRVAKDKDGKVQGFEKSWDSFEDGMYYRTTYSFFSSNQDMLKNMLANFDIKN